MKFYIVIKHILASSKSQDQKPHSVALIFYCTFWTTSLEETLTLLLQKQNWRVHCKPSISGLGPNILCN